MRHVSGVLMESLISGLVEVFTLQKFEIIIFRTFTVVVLTMRK